MSAAPWAAHFGLTRTPFGKSIAAKDLFARPAHAEAIARIGFCVVESALGVVTGDVGAGKTVALRAAVAGLDPTRHQVIYIANPAFGTRGLYVTIVRALGAQPAAPPCRSDLRPMPSTELCRQPGLGRPGSLAGAGFLRAQLAVWSA